MLVQTCRETGGLVGMPLPFLGSSFPAVVAEGTSVLSTGAAHRRVLRREIECTGLAHRFFWKKARRVLTALTERLVEDHLDGLSPRTETQH